MKNIEPPDSFRLSAAAGWIELGNPREAELEMEAISPEWQGHPEVLLVRWELLARAKQWEQALGLAATVRGLDPGRCDGWIKQAYCLHELGRTSEAWETLRPAVEEFPDVGVVRYNLACYACRLGQKTEALKLIRQAMKLSGREQIKDMAREDTDLEALRQEIARL